MQQQERSEWRAGWEEASASARSRKEVSVVRGSYLNVRSCFGSQPGTLADHSMQLEHGEQTERNDSNPPASMRVACQALWLVT
jgi:hypothetical protein